MFKNQEDSQILIQQRGQSLIGLFAFYLKTPEIIYSMANAHPSPQLNYTMSNASLLLPQILSEAI